MNEDKSKKAKLKENQSLRPSFSKNKILFLNLQI